MARGGVFIRGASTTAPELTDVGSAGQVLTSNGADADPTWQAPASTPPPSSGTLNTFLVSGGQVVWESGFTFRVSAASYYINGVRYDSDEQTITLDAADGSNPRIDAIVLDTAGDVQKITGTAAAAASEPSVDPATYVKLAIVSVPAGATEPAGATNATLYAEAAGAPGEWNWTSSGASIVVNSTNNPHTGTIAIEGTSVVTGVYARGTIGSGSIEPNDYEHLIIFVRSKAAWNSSRGLLISFRSSGVLLGAAVQLRRTGTFGFDSTVTTAYQQVAIPITAFAIPEGTTATQLQIEDFGGSIGFYIDNITLQVGATTPAPAGITEAQADARYAPLIHAPRHQAGGADPIRLDDLAAPEDNTDLNASTSTHGLLRKLDNDTTHFLRGDGSWAVPPGSGSGITELTGDVTAGPGTGSQAATIPNDTVSNAKLANMAQATVKGRASGAGTGDPTDLTAAQVKAILALEATVGAVLTTAGEVQYIRVPFAMTVTRWDIAGDASGSAVVDVWKNASPPPTVADTIAGSEKPTLSSQQFASDAALGSFSTSIAAGDWLAFKLESLSTATRVLVQLTGTRS